MARHSKPTRDPLAEAESAVLQLAGSPLDTIAQGLKSALGLTNGAHARGELAREQLVGLSEYVTTVVRSLPRTYGDRFWFDAGLIRAMAGDWGDPRLFSPMIIPCYEKQWGYARLPMPLTELCHGSSEPQSHVVELIMVPGNDDLQN